MNYIPKEEKLFKKQIRIIKENSKMETNFKKIIPHSTRLNKKFVKTINIPFNNKLNKPFKNVLYNSLFNQFKKSFTETTQNINGNIFNKTESRKKKKCVS